MSRQELLETIEREATELEKTYHGCPRCVLMPLEKHLGIGGKDVARSSLPLAGGAGLRGDVCGSLLGGLIAVGLAVSDEDVTNHEAFLETVKAAYRFQRRFEKEFGAVNCRDLQTARLGAYYSMAKPDEYEAFVRIGGYDVCSAIAGTTSRLAAEFLLEMHDRGRLRVPLNI
jgi:hypothetical protein